MAKRITITLDDAQEERFNEYAKAERRKDAQMGLVLIDEALVARELKRPKPAREAKAKSAA